LYRSSALWKRGYFNMITIQNTFSNKSKRIVTKRTAHLKNNTAFNVNDRNSFDDWLNYLLCDNDRQKINIGMTYAWNVVRPTDTSPARSAFVSNFEQQNVCLTSFTCCSRETVYRHTHVYICIYVLQCAFNARRATWVGDGRIPAISNPRTRFVSSLPDLPWSVSIILHRELMINRVPNNKILLVEKEKKRGTCDKNNALQTA